jgi:RNA polymerase sigma factor (TIGR02999 family)
MVAHPSRDHMDRLFEHLYQELRALAIRQMSRERPNHTLQPTALVNEVYIKLRNQRLFEWRSETNFMALASKAMRQVLIDLGRKRKANRRAGERASVDLESIERTGGISLEDSIVIHLALEKLASQEPNGKRQAELVEWVWLGGMKFTEAAQWLGISRRQAHRDWAWARTWLARELSA